MRRVAIILIAIALLAAGRDTAEAGRMKFLSALPTEAGRERVVKVLELPDTADFTLRDGSFFDLGYLMRTDGTGEWVGFVGSDALYIPLGPKSLAFIMEHAGIDKLPPEPKPEVSLLSRLDLSKMDIGAIDPRLLVLLLIPLLLVVGVMRFVRRQPRVKIELPKTASAEAPQEGGKDWLHRAHASVNAAAPPMESPIIRAARERAERIRQQAPAVRGQIAKSPELANRPDFGRLGGRR